MKSTRIHATFVTILLALVPAVLASAKPLKVFILAGQSNMEGHAQTMTFPAMAKDPAVAALYKKMVGPDGQPVVCDDVWISYAYGDFSGKPAPEYKTGRLTAGFGSQHHVGTGKIGPEFSFGITISELLGEPVLLIKNAWGGKSLMVDFRPPSAGALEDEKHKDKAGVYYDLTIQHVKSVLADPKKVYPGYDPQQGYEIAGFVWFQGFNDMVGNYPRVDPDKGKKSTKDYSEYSRLLGCLIRDVRKDLGAPGLPFVIGVLGVGGENGSAAFRAAMAAPALTDEFKGSVANVFTHEYWPAELDAVQAKLAPIKSEAHVLSKQLKDRNLPHDEWKKEQAKITAGIRAKTEAALTKDELFLLENGISNQAFHYHGSAKFFARIGEAFATTMAGLQKR